MLGYLVLYCLKLLIRSDSLQEHATASATREVSNTNADRNLAREHLRIFGEFGRVVLLARSEATSMRLVATCCTSLER